MTEDITDNDNEQPEINPVMVSLDKFREDKQKEASDKPKLNWPKSGDLTGPITITPEEPPIERSYIITLEDGEIEIQGQVGFTQAFLMIGDLEGRVKFAAADGFWKYIVDKTDLKQPEYLKND